MNCLEEIHRAKNRAVKDLGEAIGASERTVSHYQRDDTRLALPVMRKLSPALRITVGDLAGDAPEAHMGETPDHLGGTPPAASYVSVRSIAASPAMGAGSFADDDADIEGPLSCFPEDLIRYGLHRRPEQLRVMDVVSHPLPHPSHRRHPRSIRAGHRADGHGPEPWRCGRAPAKG